MNLAGIDKALKDGCRLHAFRSGGGLRVVRIEKGDKLMGYGEHPHIDDALSHANEDFIYGKRLYKEVYGVTKPHYLTGSPTPTSQLDNWILQGKTFDVWQDRDRVVFQLNGLILVEAPKKIVDRVLRSGVSATWENRGYTYRITRSVFSDSDFAASCKVINRQKCKKNNPWMYYIVKTGHGKSFWTAMNKAFKAKRIEVER